LGVEAWPFKDYGVFRARISPQGVQIGRIRGVGRGDRGEWLLADDLGAGFNGYYDGTNFLRFYLARTGRRIFSRDAPQLLADFRQHLPAAARERFQRLEYVARFVVPSLDGRWRVSEMVLFESGPAPQ